MKFALPATALALGLCLLTHAPAEKSASEITKEFIYTTAPFPSSHASTLVQLKSGDLMAAWFGGTYEGKPDVAIWSSVRSSDGWSKPVELAREPNTPCWNPVLFHTHDARLWLYYKFGPNPSSWSTDEGRTWSPIEHLPAGILGPIREKPLLEANGHILSGSSVESYHAWAVWIERSTDNGRTWTKIGPITYPNNNYPNPGRPSTIPPANQDGVSGIIQPVIVELSPGHFRLYARATENIGHIVIADSTAHSDNDDGLNWSPTRLLALPNPNSGIDAIRLKDGRIVLIYNDSTQGRTPLNLAVSRDGEHFHNFATLENTPGEYSYPAIIQQRDGSLSATWTWQRTRIRYAHIPLATIPKS
jgi:predicted neuraminidase